MDYNENTSFHDDAPSDREMNKYLENLRKNVHSKKLAKGVVEDEDTDGDDYSKDLMDDDDLDFDNDDDYVFRE